MFRKFESRRVQLNYSYGFSLPELLVVLLIGGLVIPAITSLMVQHLQTSVRSEVQQRLREEAGRLGYLLQVESSEAREIKVAQNMPECGIASGIKSIITLYVPWPEGDVLNPLNTSYIHYYQDGDNLRRCGPRTNVNGTLDHGFPPAGPVYVDAMLSRDTLLEPVFAANASCNNEITDGLRQFVYQIKQSSTSASKFAIGCAVARAKSFYVQDPPPPP
ncbi:prepilin-type N-terminal cleavage/methylation domain-containing protein [Cyanobium sp. FACHB-13342]|uniref:prepilin-type N-terminal cleavage/methylation domain-containing protein n=1 Tax=Cyanobium sp. FACHB-13342 TaxID=2692793 RepID=UPI001680F9AC|nr:prepilin-type N-terminal cleavage/methylation domain-containing protein [Cyanobium sp. FACHB-13342]